MLDLADRYGEERADEVEIYLPLSQDDLAGFLSVSRRTVADPGATAGKHLIGTGRRSILIKSGARLATLRIVSAAVCKMSYEVIGDEWTMNIANSLE